MKTRPPPASRETLASIPERDVRIRTHHQDHGVHVLSVNVDAVQIIVRLGVEFTFAGFEHGPRPQLMLTLGLGILGVILARGY